MTHFDRPFDTQSPPPAQITTDKWFNTWLMISVVAQVCCWFRWGPPTAPLVVRTGKYKKPGIIPLLIQFSMITLVILNISCT